MVIKKSSSGELATVKIEFQKLWFRVPQRRRKPVETGFKNTNFSCHPGKNGNRHQMNTRFPPPLIQRCLRYHRNYAGWFLHQNNLE